MQRTSNLHWAVKRAGVVAALIAATTQRAVAQDSASASPYSKAVATWIALVATPGYERLAGDRVLSATSGWSRDGVGNLVKHVGEGAPTRVVACGLDESDYAVSSITDDGYLRLHMNGNERHVALWDQYHEGQRVIVYAVERANPARIRFVPGVVATRSNHLWRKRVNDQKPATIEDMYVDVGARSKAEVTRMGIDVLDPVVRDWPEWTFNDYVAGPAAGNRAECEAVAAAAASNNKPATETVFIIAAQKGFAWSGLTSALARLGHVDSLTIVDAQIGGSRSTAHRVSAPWNALGSVDVGSVQAIGVPTRFPGTLTESVRETDLIALHRAVSAASGIGPSATAPVQLAPGWTAAPPVIIRDSLSKYADVIAKLTEIYALSGFEQPMRDAIQPLLPAALRDQATVDSAGNLIIAMGPERDTSVFIALRA